MAGMLALTRSLRSSASSTPRWSRVLLDRPLIALLGGLLAVPATGQDEPLPVELQLAWEEARPSVVLILTTDAQGLPMAMGTGFYVQEGLIATSATVTKGVSTFHITRHDGVTFEATEVRSSSQALDVALIEVSEPGTALSLAGGGPQGPDASPVLVFGKGPGLESVLSVGEVRGRARFGPGHSAYEFSAPIPLGSVGGPVLLPSGKVLGVATVKFRTSEVAGHVVSPDPLLDLAPGERSYEPTGFSLVPKPPVVTKPDDASPSDESEEILRALRRGTAARVDPPQGAGQDGPEDPPREEMQGGKVDREQEGGPARLPASSGDGETERGESLLSGVKGPTAHVIDIGYGDDPGLAGGFYAYKAGGPGWYVTFNVEGSEDQNDSSASAYNNVGLSGGFTISFGGGTSSLVGLHAGWGVGSRDIGGYYDIWGTYYPDTHSVSGAEVGIHILPGKDAQDDLVGLGLRYSSAYEAWVVSLAFGF